MARRVFGEAALPQSERDAHGLARWLVQQKPIPETINARELRRMAGGPSIPDSARMADALDELADAVYGFDTHRRERGQTLAGSARIGP